MEVIKVGSLARDGASNTCKSLEFHKSSRTMLDHLGNNPISNLPDQVHTDSSPKTLGIPQCVLQSRQAGSI